MSSHDYWLVALVIGLVAALVVAALLLILVRTVPASRSRSTACWSPAKVAGNTANIPQLEATAPVLGLIVDGGRRPGRLHERPHRRIRWR